MAAVGSGTVGGNSNSSSAERWYFTAEELSNSASRACGIDPEKELTNRQQTANLIQEMGQRLHVNQLCINTAIVYMHRFYRFHSFTKFNRNDISQCALFLAAKVEEQPRKLEHVIKCARAVLSKTSTSLDPTSEEYLAMAAELVANENLMLQTLGFDIGIDHPHTHVVKCCQLVKATKELAQTSYFLATNTLHFTTMCLQYKPTVVACICIHVACKWTDWQIPVSTENKQWFNYIDDTVTLQLLEELSAEFLACLDKCPERMRNRVFSCLKNRENNPGSVPRSHLQPSPAQPPHHRSDPNAAQRMDPNRGSGRTSHPTHQPDSTTLIADRRRTAPPSSQQQQQQQQQPPPQQTQAQQQQQSSSGHGHRIPGHHSSSSSDRYSYSKEHQRPSQTQNLASNSSQGRHSLPANVKPAQVASTMVHPKKQYQQQHYLGGQQQQQQQQSSQQHQSQQQAALDVKPPRVGNNGAGQQTSTQPPAHLLEQSRRPHIKQDMHHHPHHQQQQQQQQQLLHQSNSMPMLNNQLPSKPTDIKAQTSGRNQGLGGVLDESSGLLKPADFTQPYPSCASPPAHNPMFEGDSSSMENDFLSGIVSQTSPNNNSGSNSLGFGGSFSQQKQLSPPETQHRLSSPRAYSVGPDLAGGLIPKKEPVSSLIPSYPNNKHEASMPHMSTPVTKAQSAHPHLMQQEVSEPSSLHQQLQIPSHGQQQQQLPQQPHQQPQQSSLSETAANPSMSRGDIPDASKHLLHGVSKANLLTPAMSDGSSSNPVVVTAAAAPPSATAPSGAVLSDHPALPTARHPVAVQDPLLTIPNAPQLLRQHPQSLNPTLPEISNSQTDSRNFGGREQTELESGKKHKKKKEKKEKKEKRHKDDKKKKKKKDKDRDRETRSRSRSRSSSPIASSATPVFQPIQMGGVKLKIKVINPSKHVAGSDSDSNAGNNGAIAGSSSGGGDGDTNLKIKIPIDKFDSDRKEKRKRKEEFYEESTTKSRKFH